MRACVLCKSGRRRIRRSDHRRRRGGGLRGRGGRSEGRLLLRRLLRLRGLLLLLRGHRLLLRLLRALANVVVLRRAGERGPDDWDENDVARAVLVHAKRRRDHRVWKSVKLLKLPAGCRCRCGGALKCVCLSGKRRRRSEVKKSGKETKEQKKEKNSNSRPSCPKRPRRQLPSHLLQSLRRLLPRQTRQLLSRFSVLIEGLGRSASWGGGGERILRRG